MVSSTAISITTFLQVLMRTSLFLEQHRDQCSSAPGVSAFLFLISIIDLLSDINFFPVRYMHLPFACQVFAETLLTIYIVEFGLNILWCTIERLLSELISSIFKIFGWHDCFFNEWEWYVLGVVTTALSLTILFYVFNATDHFCLLKMEYCKLKRQIQARVSRYSKIYEPKLCRRKKSKSKIFNSRDEITDNYDCQCEVLMKRKRQKSVCH